MTAPTTSQLPEGFEGFAPFLDWAIPRQADRAAKKMTSTFDQLKALYDFGMADDNIARALAYCDQFPLSDLPEDAATLFHITLSMAEVRPQVELYRQVHQPIPGKEVLPSRLPPLPDYDQL